MAFPAPDVEPAVVALVSLGRCLEGGLEAGVMKDGVGQALRVVLPDASYVAAPHVNIADIIIPPKWLQ